MSEELSLAYPAAPRIISIADAKRHEGQQVQIRGWLYNLRKSGKIVFPQVRDGSGLMQCVAVKKQSAGRRIRDAQEFDAGKLADADGNSAGRTARGWRV